MEFLVDNLAPIMFFNLIVFLLLGFPVTFTLSAIGILYGLVAIELDMMQPALFQALPQRVFGIVENDTLLAVPFFTLMGLILERSGMAEDLLDTIGQLFGPLRGGLAIAVVLVGAMLAATTGVVSASVISMGLISLPIMLRYGYDRKLATGVIAASGTLSQIIPPSIVLIILADQLGRSIGDMYRGAMLPGLMLVATYVLYVVVMSYIKPKSAPALPPEARVYVEPNGSRGLTSLLVLSIVASAVAYFGSQHYFATHPNIPMDEHIVVLMLLWGVTAWVIALINKLVKLNMLSKIAEPRRSSFTPSMPCWRVVSR